MNIQEFICKYQEAFGKNTPLPITFGYHHKAAEEVKKIPRCMIGAIRKVCNGKPLTLSADNVLCGGGSLYTAFAPMPDRVPVFVSEVEHYKQNQEQVKAYINQLDIRLTEKPYLNFIRIDQLESLEEMEGILFFATLGMLDPSARPLVPKNELTFTIPMCRFKEMLDTMEQSALFQKAYSIVRKRINGEIQKETE